MAEEGVEVAEETVGNEEPKPWEPASVWIAEPDGTGVLAFVRKAEGAGNSLATRILEVSREAKVALDRAVGFAEPPPPVELATVGKAKAKADAMAPARIAPKLTIGDIVSLAEGAPADLSALIVGEAEADLAADAAALGNPEVLVRLPVVVARSAGDALQLAARDRTPETARAIALFRTIQKAAGRYALGDLLKNRAFLARLREITELEPRHLSARTLLILGVQGELRISRRGSLAALDALRDRCPDLYGTAFDPTPGGLPVEDACREQTSLLRRLRPRLHEDAVPRADAMADFLAARRAYAEVDDKRTQKAESLAADLRGRLDALFPDPVSVAAVE